MSFGLLLAPATAMVAHAQTEATGQISCGASGQFTETECSDPGADQVVTNSIELAIRILQLVVGIISVVMIIFGGIKYITSGGDAGAVSSAKNTIIYACIGLVVVALAEVIVQFVLNRVDTTA